MCRGLARLGDSAPPPTPTHPGVPPATPTKTKERRHCPSFPALPLGDRTWGLTPGPLSCGPGEEGVAWSAGPRNIRQGTKDNYQKASSVIGGLAHPFGEIVILLVLGAPSSSTWGMEMAIGFALQGLGV